ncbi:hypothetical protein CBER1_06444 [Cercospora berteroae]|uniref:CSD domain-containing protein n=1 Tax=Cercospora berteroae TaxID=357750 RepID=A0A2S6BS77_9PEZI|nr:hypothetical protein CBER1_06444 [Cercospora berteroae]
MRFLQATVIAFAALVASSAALKGTVKSWDDEKGIGYITPDDESPDVYFYRSEVDPEDRALLEEGKEVDFDLKSGPKRQKTVNGVPQLG